MDYLQQHSSRSATHGQQKKTTKFQKNKIYIILYVINYVI